MVAVRPWRGDGGAVRRGGRRRDRGRPSRPSAAAGGAPTTPTTTTRSPGDEREPRVELLGDDEPREQERDEAEREDPGRVGDGHGRAEDERVARRSARADEVPGDERLAVARRERVHGAPEGGDEEREEDDAEREVATLDQRLEATRSMRGSRLRRDRRRHGVARCPARTSAVALRTSSGERGDPVG